MATTNGVLSPQTNPEIANPAPLSAKRKRESDSGESPHHANGIADSKGTGIAGGISEDSETLVRDLIDVLRSSDTTPSILNRTIPDCADSAEPQAKRQKAEDASVESSTSNSTTTILMRLSSSTYSSLDDVLKDIDTAVSDIIESLHLPHGRAQYITPSSSQSELSAKVSAFKKRAHELVRREKARMEKKTNVLPNGVMRNGIYSNGSLGANAVTQINANSNDNRVVLTLYGTASGPKQLFSSLQMPINVDGEDVVQPLREAGLPNGITTTQIVPIQSTGLIDDRKRPQTLGEMFPSPANLLPLQPPKPSMVATTRSTTVGWYQPVAAAAETRLKTGSYFNQSVSTGQWLDYTNAAPPPSPKRKRDRALSAVGARPLTSEIDTAESEASKLDALFRSAYSGFAPTKDDAAAIVPEGLVNRIWWQRVGAKNFERLVETSPNFEVVATDPIEDDSRMVEDVSEMESFKQTVEQWGNERIDPSLVSLGIEPQFEKSASEKDVDEILEGISELLETLNSYQRIRHLQLNPSRVAGLLSASETSTGTPTKPSDSELATYETLKSQLALMIATLPPYAVAKLDSDRLGELNISTRMEIQVDDYKGVMEEDEASARAKAANLSAGVGSATSARATPSLNHRPSSTSLYGNQFPSASRPVGSGSMPYAGATQTPVRQPSSNNWPRPPSTAPVPYPTQRPGSSAPYRPGGYPGTPTYPHQTPRPQAQYPQYTASNQSHNASTTQRYNTPTTPAYGRPTGQPYSNGSMPQTAPQQRYGQNPGGAYPQQSQSTQNGMDYRYANGVPGRQPSPQKPQSYSPQPSLAHPHGRPSYSTPTPPVAQARSYLQASNPMMNGVSPAPQPQQQQYQRTVSSPYASSVMTTEQQASMMERQRAQLVQQQEIQEQARIAAQASAQLAGGQSASPKVTVAAGGL